MLILLIAEKNELDHFYCYFWVLYAKWNGKQVQAKIDPENGTSYCTGYEDICILIESLVNIKVNIQTQQDGKIPDFLF